MKIKILGTRGEIEPSAPYHAKHSGVLIDKALLLDLGEKSFLALGPQYIFVTHLHPDHAVFVKEPLETTIPVYLPESYQNNSSRARIASGASRVQLRTRVITRSISLDPYQVTPIPTLHSKRVKSTAYLIKKGGQKLLYTGDVAWIEKKYHQLFKNLDLVVTDGSYLRKGGLIRRDAATGKIYGHTGIPNLVSLFKGYTKQILFIHFGSWFYKMGAPKARKEIKKLGERAGLTARIGYDGMELDL